MRGVEGPSPSRMCLRRSGSPQHPTRAPGRTAGSRPQIGAETAIPRNGATSCVQPPAALPDESVWRGEERADAELSVRVSRRAGLSQNHQGSDSRGEFTVVTGQTGCFYCEIPDAKALSREMNLAVCPKTQDVTNLHEMGLCPAPRSHRPQCAQRQTPPDPFRWSLTTGLPAAGLSARSDESQLLS